MCQAYASNYLTLKVYKNLPRSLTETFEKFNLIVINGSYVNNITFEIDRHAINPRNVLKSNMTIYELIDLWKDLSHEFGIIINEGMFDYFFRKMIDYKKDLHMVPDSIVKYQLCFYFRKGSFLRTVFTQHLLDMIDMGFVNWIYQKELRTLALPVSTPTPKEAEPIQMTDVELFVILYICGVVASLLTFCFEFLYLVFKPNK